MDEIVLFLIICLLGCIIYIIWLHREHNKKTLNQKNEKTIKTNDIDDNLSFLKSEYSMTEAKKEDDSDDIEAIIGDE